jgi:hypothetical protein
MRSCLGSPTRHDPREPVVVGGDAVMRGGAAELVARVGGGVSVGSGAVGWGASVGWDETNGWAPSIVGSAQVDAAA